MQKSALKAFVSAMLLDMSLNASAESFMPWTEIMTMADKNKDGMVTPHEVMYFDSKTHVIGFQPFMVVHFSDLDNDGGGMVSLDQAKACRDRLGMNDDEFSKVFFARQGSMPRQDQ